MKNERINYLLNKESSCSDIDYKQKFFSLKKNVNDLCADIEQNIFSFENSHKSILNNIGVLISKFRKNIKELKWF